MKQRSISLQSLLAPSPWKAIVGVSILIISIIAFRVYWWHKSVSRQGTKPPEGDRPPLVLPVERERIQEFRGYLETLDRTDLNSIQRGRNYFQQNLLTLPPSGKDTAFMAFLDFYYQVIQEYNKKQVLSPDELLRARLDAGNSRGMHTEDYLQYLNDPAALKQDPQVQTLMEKLFQNGLKMTLTEDKYSVSERPGYLYDKFGADLSEALRNFLAFRRDELSAGFLEDGALLISYRDLGERVIVWERFLTKYPDCVVNGEAGNLYLTYLDTFIAGTENERIFDDNGVLKRELKLVYYNFKTRYSKTKSGKLISRFYEVLLHNNFKNSRQAQEFYRLHKTKSWREILK